MALAKLDLRDVVVDPDGVLNAGGFVYTYAATTTTPLVTYSDGLGTENTNPVELDASGQWACYLTIGTAYRLDYATVDGDGNPGPVFYTADNIVIPDATAAPGSQYVDVVFTYPGGPPVANGWIGGERFTRAVTFPANFSGSFGKVPKALPTASYAIPIQINGVTVGAATCATNGTWTFTTVGGAVVNVVIGDEGDAYGPATPDTTIADFGFTLAGSLA